MMKTEMIHLIKQDCESDYYNFTRVYPEHESGKYQVWIMGIRACSEIENLKNLKWIYDQILD